MVCLGMMIPLAASPVRICLIEHKIVDAGQEPCCPKCKKETKHDPGCCVQLDELPDSPPAGFPEGVPPVIVLDLPPQGFILPLPELVAVSIFSVGEPIRGPDGSCGIRALFGVWRL